MCIDRRARFIESETWICIRQVEISLKERANRSDILPISLEDVGPHGVFPDSRRDDVFTKVGEIVVETFPKNVALEHINTHRGLIQIGIAGVADRLQEIARDAKTIENLRIFRFLDELDDLPSFIGVHDPKACCRGAIHGNGATVISELVSRCWRKTWR